MSSPSSRREPLFSVQLERHQSSTSVTVTGDVDAVTAPELDGVLNGVIALDDGPVTVDLSGIEFMGSAGARSLLAARHALCGLDRGLRLVGVPVTVERVLAIVGWDNAGPPS